MRQSILAVLSLLLIAADPLEGDKFLEKADEKFEQAAERTQQAFAKSMREAYETRLKTYRSILAAATKAGDFDRATAVKAKIEEIEAERDEIVEEPAGKKKATKISRDALAFGGHHYALFPEHVTWHVARTKCEELGGHLVCLETPAERAAIFELCGKTSAWVGATDEVTEGEWRWVNGVPAVNLDARIENGSAIEHNLAYNANDGRLDDWAGGARIAFVCEWDR